MTDRDKTGNPFTAPQVSISLCNECVYNIHFDIKIHTACFRVFPINYHLSGKVVKFSPHKGKFMSCVKIYI